MAGLYEFDVLTGERRPITKPVRIDLGADYIEVEPTEGGVRVRHCSNGAWARMVVEPEMSNVVRVVRIAD